MQIGFSTAPKKVLEQETINSMGTLECSPPLKYMDIHSTFEQKTQNTLLAPPSAHFETPRLSLRLLGIRGGGNIGGFPLGQLGTVMYLLLNLQNPSQNPDFSDEFRSMFEELYPYKYI